jgi:hypothetical protein
MKNSGEAIGKVLAGLRDSEAPPDLERRILAAVEARASERPVATPRWVWSAVIAGVVTVSIFIAITAIHRHWQTTTQAQQHTVPEGSTRGTQQALFQPHEPITPIRMPARTVSPGQTMQPISAADAVLLREMRAPSHPAPEAPLTQEEKLLLRVVHTGDPQLMAMLDPEERAKQEAASEAEFQKFVEQSGKENHESNQITE